MFLKLHLIISGVFILFVLNACQDRDRSFAPQADSASSVLTYQAIEIKRFPLPLKHLDSLRRVSLSPREYLQRLAVLESRLGKVLTDTIPPLEKQRRTYDLAGQIGVLKDHAFLKKAETVCGEVDNSVNVEEYAPKNGVPSDFMTEKARSVGLIRWNKDLGRYFTGRNDNAGDVAGHCWGSGCLIGNDIFITAGHCFDPMVNGNKTPMRNGTPLNGKEFAKYMNVIFNFQKVGSSASIRSDTVCYPVIELIEYRESQLDYAIIRLGKDNEGHSAGSKFGTIMPAPLGYESKIGDTLMVVQHPDGDPKRIDCGPLYFLDDTYLFYDQIDTKEVSSGAPVINYRTGLLAGIHVTGNCTKTDGSNQALRMRAMRKVSKILP